MGGLIRRCFDRQLFVSWDVRELVGFISNNNTGAREQNVEMSRWWPEVCTLTVASQCGVM